jgi:transposase
VLRSFGLDVHRDFCEVASFENGRTGRGGSRTIRGRSSSLAAEDQVAMEATSNALAIARILEGHVARVVLAHLERLM